MVLGISGSLIFGSQLLRPAALPAAHSFVVPTALKLPAKPVAPVVLPAAQPTHISIASVNIDADIIQVGLDSHGAVELPPILSWQAGWYRGSPTPGQLGPAIIVGHVDTYKGISVFWRLRYVKAGDSIIINRADGRPATFVITALDQYDQQSFPTATVYDNLPYAGLKLITCGGTFDTQTGHYSQNTVVTAKLQL